MIPCDIRYNLLIKLPCSLLCNECELPYSLICKVVCSLPIKLPCSLLSVGEYELP